MDGATLAPWDASVSFHRLKALRDALAPDDDDARRSPAAEVRAFRGGAAVGPYLSLIHI